MSNQNTTPQSLVKKVWTLANVIVVGVVFTDYVNQLTYLLFLKKGDSSHRTVY